MEFDPNSLITVTTVADIESLPSETAGVFVLELTNDKLSAIAVSLPDVRHIIADGNTSGVTDAGLASLIGLARLESLDLEWSNVTDEGLLKIAHIESLRWVDLGFCKGVSERGAAEFRRLRPEVEATFSWT